MPENSPVRGTAICRIGVVTDMNSRNWLLILRAAANVQAAARRRDGGILSFHEALAYGVADQVGGLVDVEFVHDAGAVTICRFYADAQAGSDFLSGVTFRDQGDDLAF